MIAVFDACTILNLLQVTMDEKYITYIKKVYTNFSIPSVVYKEINDNKWKNVIDADSRKYLDDLINKNLSGTVDHQLPEKEVIFMKKVLGNLVQNGEFMCVGHAMRKSRDAENEFGENTGQVTIFTDDMPATSQFADFYRLNLVGTFLDSMDLMVVFCLKGLISFNDVIKYCNNLKLNYSKPASILLRMLKDHKENSYDLSIKQATILSKLIYLLSEIENDVVDKVETVVAEPDFKSIKNLPANFAALLKEFLHSNFRTKIPEINKRIDLLTSQLYT